MSISAFIAYRYSNSGTRHSFVAFINRFSIIGITLGIASLIMVVSVMNGLEGQLKKRILGILPHIIVDTPEPLQIPSALSSKVDTQLPFIQQEIVVQSKNNISGLLMLGVDEERSKPHSIIADNIVDGQWDSLRADSFNVAISRILANQMNVDIGHELRLISTTASVYSPLGRIPSQRLARVTAIFDVNSEMDDKVVIINIKDAARLSRKRLSDIQSQRIYLSDAFDYETVISYLNSEGLNFHLWRERQGPLFDAVKMEKNMMSLMLLLVIAVAAFNVVSALVMVVSEKKADIAILQTQGMMPKQIMAIFLLNGVFNGLKGIISGLFIGLIGCWQLNALLDLMGSNLAFGENGQGLPIDVQYAQLMIISGSALALCLIASWYPAYKAQAIQPANSLRSE